MSGKVKLTVFNIKGETVATLIDGNLRPSIHRVNFDAAALNSGVYYYRLQTPAKTITKKMIMVK